jgi:hypothetical protein
MTQHKDRKQAIRTRMAATGEPYTEAARNLEDAVPARPGPVWLNPPHHDDPHEDIIIELTPAAAAVVADALTEAAVWAGNDGDREAARVLAHVADDIEAASVTPAEADKAGLSREATWHPANIMQRLTPAAIRNAARYLGPSYVASNAIKVAAAIAWSKGGQAAKDEVLDHCRRVVEDAAAEGCPDHTGPGTPWFDVAPPATAARVKRRRQLGLPPA